MWDSGEWEDHPPSCPFAPAWKELLGLPHTNSRKRTISPDIANVP